MPIYLLGSRTAKVEIPNQAISISITGSVAAAMLCIDPHGGQDTVRVNRHLVIVPSVTEGLTIGVRPERGEVFAAETVVYLAIGPDSPTEFDPIQVNFDPVNVSGIGAAELAELAPRGSGIEVAVRSVADTPMSPLAGAARTAARRGAGIRRENQTGALSIGVDTSASMARAFDDGSVSAAIDLIVGVADAAGIRDVRASLIGARCTPVSAAAGGLASAVSQMSLRWSAGTQWARLPDADRTIVVTDALNRCGAHRFPALFVSANERLVEAGPLLRPPPPGVAADQHLTETPGLVDEIAAVLLRSLT